VPRQLSGGLELDDDPKRVDLDRVHDFLANHSYWAKGRSRETVERLVREADRVVGLYHDGRQVGFCRAFTDGVTLAYLADVYVLPELRGRGLGVELVREMVDNGPYAALRWVLHTEDAHGVYRKLDFAEPGYKLMERAARRDRPGSADSGT
jgi:GNAT superfamily N-acetyltransferase